MKPFFREGQISFEYLALAGILLAVMLPILYTSLSTVYEHYKLTRLEDVVSQIAMKADDLYRLGPGNKDELHLIIPSGITGASVAGKEVELQTHLRNYNISARRQTEADIVGTLEIIQGEYIVPIKALNQTLVRIGSGPWIVEINPSCIGAPNFADPPNITLNGDDFLPTSVLLLDGVPFDSAFFQIIDPGTIIFIAGPSQFWAQPSGNPYVLSVQDDSKISNTVSFWVYPSPQLCP